MPVKSVYIPQKIIENPSSIKTTPSHYHKDRAVSGSRNDRTLYIIWWSTDPSLPSSDVVLTRGYPPSNIGNGQYWIVRIGSVMLPFWDQDCREILFLFKKVCFVTPDKTQDRKSSKSYWGGIIILINQTYNIQQTNYQMALNSVLFC